MDSTFSINDSTPITEENTPSNFTTVTPNSSVTAIYIIYHLGEIVIALGAALGNALVMWVVVKEKRLHTTTNVLIVSLAVADFLVGIVGIPCALVAFNGRPVSPYGCLLVNSVIVVFTQMSIFGLLVIAIERFLAIKLPFHYHTHFTIHVACVVIGCYWLAAVIVGLIPLFGWNLLDTYPGQVCAFMDIIDMNYMVYCNFFGFVLTPLLIMFAIYCYICQVVVEKNKQIAVLQVASNLGGSSNGQTTNDERRSFKSELRAAKLFAVVIGLFAFCWLPLHITNTVGIYGYAPPFEWLIATILLSHLNSAVNPVLYALSNHKFKAAIKKLFGLHVTREDLETLGYNAASHFNQDEIRHRTFKPQKRLTVEGLAATNKVTVDLSNNIHDGHPEIEVHTNGGYEQDVA